MSKQIWVRKGQEVRGPFSVAQVRQLAEEGKLTPRHEISSDQKRWKSAASVSGLGVCQRELRAGGSGRLPAIRAVPGKCSAAVAKSQGSQFALGVLLLVIVALVVAGACAVEVGIGSGRDCFCSVSVVGGDGLPGGVFGAGCVRDLRGGDGRGLGDAPGRIAGAVWDDVFLLDPFCGGADSGGIDRLGLDDGLARSGTGYRTADVARLNLGRFSSAPISNREFQRIFSVDRKGIRRRNPLRRCELRLDPDDLERADDSLGEKIEEEARRSVPGLAVSVVVHALLLVGFWFVRLQFPGRTGFRWSSVGFRPKSKPRWFRRSNGTSSCRPSISISRPPSQRRRKNR